MGDQLQFVSLAQISRKIIQQLNAEHKESLQLSLEKETGKVVRK
jgi:hypothetical protein